MSEDLFSAARTAAPRVTGRQALGSSETKRHRDLETEHRDLAARRDADKECRVCGAPAGFGFGGPMRLGKPYRWACMDHREDVAGMSE